MNTFVFGTSRSRARVDLKAALLLRSWLIVACVAAVLAVARFGAASTLLRTDPELAQLLRGMALIKATIAFAAIAVSWWRFGRATPRVAAATYIVGAGLMAGATVSIWQLSSLLAAAVVFHIGLFALLLAAWRVDLDAVADGPIRWLSRR